MGRRAARYAALLCCGVLLWTLTACGQDGEGRSAAAATALATSAPAEAPEMVTVVIDAGHGGNQPGCVVEDILEKDITLSIARRLRDELENRGIAVLLTREADDSVGLEERVDMARQARAAAFVSIHCNAFEGDSSVHGVECYYYQSAEGKRLAAAIRASIGRRDVKTRELKEDNLIVLRETAIPSALVEVGFLTNPQEREALLNEEYQIMLASAIADGIESGLFG